MTETAAEPRTGPQKRSWVLAGSTGQERARRLMEILRGPGGCPWDLEQTHSSLRRYLLEESYELADAIDTYEHSGETQALREELGDVYLQVLFHARIAEQANTFDIDSVADTLVTKMITRHPHVFAVDATQTTSQNVLSNWEKSKRSTEDAKPSSARKPFGNGLPRAMPALLRAQTLSARAANYGFDWPDANAVLPKLHEELAELEAATQQQDVVAAKSELGDLMLAAVNLARKNGWDSEQIMDAAAEKFRKRFESVLVRHQDAANIAEHTPEYWDTLWQAAKQDETRL